jgi:predicted nucleic acid-binding protein
MRYWDSSAILPLLAVETSTERRRLLLQEDPVILTWWGSQIECASALNRLLREQRLGEQHYEQVLHDLEVLSSGWVEVLPTEKLRRRAMRLLRVHPLRTADALQLAAALVGSGENPPSLPFVSGDPWLNEAARKEGFRLLA